MGCWTLLSASIIISWLDLDSRRHYLHSVKGIRNNLFLGSHVGDIATDHCEGIGIWVILWTVNSKGWEVLKVSRRVSRMCQKKSFENQGLRETWTIQWGAWDCLSWRPKRPRCTDVQGPGNMYASAHSLPQRYSRGTLPCKYGIFKLWTRRLPIQVSHQRLDRVQAPSDIHICIM